MRLVPLISCGVLMLASCGLLEAGQPKPKPPPPAPKANKGAKQAAKQAARQAAKQMPAEQLQRFLDMSPEDREKALSKLPDAQRQAVQQRLDNLERMSPAQRAQTLDQARRLESLPPARRQAVTTQIRSMGGLSIADQRQMIHSPEFNQNFSPEEQQLIRDRYAAAASNVVRPTDKLVPARRQALNQQVQSMSGLSVGEKRQILQSPEFNQNFSPEEQQIIRDRFPNAAK